MHPLMPPRSVHPFGVGPSHGIPLNTPFPPFFWGGTQPQHTSPARQSYQRPSGCGVLPQTISVPSPVATMWPPFGASSNVVGIWFWPSLNRAGGRQLMATFAVPRRLLASPISAHVPVPPADLPCLLQGHQGSVETITYCDEEGQGHPLLFSGFAPIPQWSPYPTVVSLPHSDPVIPQ